MTRILVAFATAIVVGTVAMIALQYFGVSSKASGFLSGWWACITWLSIKKAELVA